MMEYEDRVYFTPGMRVKTTKLKDAPEMYVLRKKELTLKDGDNKQKTLQGIVCRYLDKQGIFREELFSTKDISKIED